MLEAEYIHASKFTFKKRASLQLVEY